MPVVEHLLLSGLYLPDAEWIITISRGSTVLRQFGGYCFTMEELEEGITLRVSQLIHCGLMDKQLGTCWADLCIGGDHVRFEYDPDDCIFQIK